MAARGVNGAAQTTLNERFIKCEGCNVNIPKEDMIAMGKCTVCQRPYKPMVTADGTALEVAFVAFTDEDSTNEKKKELVKEPPKRKRWVELQSKKGRTYYHNTETGEDRWVKPADFDADAVEDAFVPFKNDAVKKAVLREQAKLEAAKLGVPLELVAKAQQQQEGQVTDPFEQQMQTLHQQRQVDGTKASSSRQDISHVHQEDIDTENDDAIDHNTEQSKPESSCVVIRQRNKVKTTYKPMTANKKLRMAQVLTLAVVMLLSSLAGSAHAMACHDDAVQCGNGDVVVRDPNNNCQMPACPSTSPSQMHIRVHTELGDTN